MRLRIKRLVCAIVIGVWAACAAQAQVAAGGAPAARSAAAREPSRTQQPSPASTLPELNLRSLKVQLEAFQDIVNQNIRGSGSDPFTLLQDAKGSYLPRFGVVFHLEVNLRPLRLITPFDMRPYTEEELRNARQAKLERVRDLKALLSALLLEHGGKLTEVPPDQNVAVIVHLFNLPSEMTEGLPTQVVLETSRRALLEAQSQGLPAAEFQKRQTLLEF